MRLWPCSTIVSIASSNVAVAWMVAIAIRGTITSWTRRLPSSMTALILCSSSASRTPCSPPRSTMRRSSSAVICASFETFAPKTFAIVLVMPVNRAISGERARARNSIGSDSAIATRSALARARVFGTSSAKTIVNSASRIVTMTSAMPWALLPAIGAMRSLRLSTRLTAAYAEAKKPMTVRPSCETARNRPGSSRRRRTRRAPGLPSSTSCSTRLRRIDTRAISPATKKPSRSVRRTMTSSSPSGRFTERSRGGPVGRGFLARLANPCRNADRELPRGDVLRDDGAGAGSGIVADRERRPEHRVDAEEDPLADRRPMLALAVEVGGDRPGADVRLGPELRVAEIAHVVLLHARTEPGVLQLGIVADLRAASHRRAGPQVRKRPDPDTVLDRRRFDDARPDDAVRSDRAVDDLAPRTDHRAGGDRGPAAQDDVRFEGHVLGDRHRRVEIDRRRVAHRHAGPHRGGVDPRAEVPLGLGKLGPVVDPGQPAVVLDGQRHDESAVEPGQLDQLGQVQLAGLRRRPERADTPAQPRGVERVEPGVDLADGELLVGRVLALDDPIDGSGVVANNSPEIAGLDGIDGDEGDRRLVEPPLLEQLYQYRRLQQRHVPGEDEDFVE